MKCRSIGEAIECAIDQARRGMTDHEYDLHLQRIKRYANKIEECEDALTVFSESETDTLPYVKWQKKLIRYKQKLEEEMSMGL